MLTSIITLIGVVTTLIIATTALIKTLQNGKQIQIVHLSLNSRLDQMLKLTADSSFAKGVKSEIAKQ